jgi:predicted AlkP superfamily phosphohydrolase/phosphomutase
MKVAAFFSLVVTLTIVLGCTGDARPAAPTGNSKMIVLGVDGMDPDLLQDLLARHELPNVRRLIDSGGFRVLGTSDPPQSPVAWSNFITGLNPGGHGMFDFLALDRGNLRPYLATSAVLPAEVGPLELGEWRIPVTGEKVILLRQGTAFWELLEDAGIDATIVRMPANYPPVPGRGNSLSGMGTPDLRGTSGTFMFFSTRKEFRPGDVSGGELRRFQIAGNRLRARVIGPANSLRQESPSLSATLEIIPDPQNAVALIRGGTKDILVNAGEWSDWVKLEFEQLPGGLASVFGIVRLYLKSVHPETELYVSPVNIDPREPAQVISSPVEYAMRLADSVGPFYTEEMPEDTKALSAHVFSPTEFLDQSDLVFNEARRMLELEIKRFNSKRAPAFLFFYFSTVDQRHHMMGRHIDRYHPAHAAGTPVRTQESMLATYREIDLLLGHVLDRAEPNVAIIMMSDHGFANFYRQAHLNAWLEQAGYLVRVNGSRREGASSDEWLPGINWSRTKAFSIGLNSLYINVTGRERNGIVSPADRLETAREIARRLENWTDEATGLPVVMRAKLREEIYRGPYLANAPDIIVGYGDGFRASWATSKGQTAQFLLEDNLDEWSADHCVDPAIAPGVLLANLRIGMDSPQLTDLTVGILDYFGVDRGPAMRGKTPFSTRKEH